MKEFIVRLQDGVLAYFWTLNAIYFFLLICGFIYIFFRTRRIESGRLDLFLDSEGLPTIGIIMPAYNEAATIVFAIYSILNLQYTNKTLIVVNDGSTDESMQLLKNTFKLKNVHHAYIDQIKTNKVLGYYHSMLHPNLIVIDKLNGGKSDAINAGINACTCDYTLTIDADSLIDNVELSRMLRYISTQPDVRAFGASVRVANGCEIKLRGITKVNFPDTYLAGSQAIEYLRAFYLGRMGWEPLQGALIISGAFALFETACLKNINGYAKILGEDMEVVIRFKRKQYEEKQSAKTSFIAEPVCWTQVPENLKILGNQRTRWQLSIMRTLWKHKSMLFNPKYGVAGLITYPYFFLGEMLSPVIEALGYLVILASWFFAISTVSFIAAFILLTIGLTFMLNAVCCAIEVIFFRKYFSYRHIGKMLLFSLIENLGYRQLTLYWRLKAFFKLLKPSTDWKDMKKTSFNEHS